MSDGGISDSAVINEVRHEPTGNQGGWTSLGKAVGSGFGGANSLQGEQAYESGMRVGAQTVDALAQAKQRVTDNEQRAKAAKMLDENPDVQQGLGLSQPLSSLFATQLAQGKDIDSVMKAATESVHFKNLTKLADPNAPMNERMAAMNSQDPNTLKPAAEGSLGSVFRPGANGGQGETTVSPLQQQNTQSEIDLRAAQAKAAGINAGAHQETADKAPNSAAGKLLTGNKWIEDPNDPSGVLHNNGQPVQGPDLNANKLTEPSTADRMHGVMVLGIGNLANEVHNIARLGFNTTLGATNISGSKPGGILEAIRQNAGNAMSSGDQQLYDTSTRQMGRFIGVNENGGRFVPEAVAQDITHNLANIPQHSEAALFGHIAAVKQIAQASDDMIQASHASPAYKEIFARRRKEVEADVPFNMDDAIDLSKGKVNPAIEKYIRSRMGSGGKAAAPPPGMTLVN